MGWDIKHRTCLSLNHYHIVTSVTLLDALTHKVSKVVDVLLVCIREDVDDQSVWGPMSSKMKSQQDGGDQDQGGKKVE